MFTYKKIYTSARRPVPHLGTKIGSPAYIIKKIYNIHQGASITPPTSPPSGGGGVPPPPAPGGGGGTPAGPPCSGDRRPLVIAESTAACLTIPRHGGGSPMHFSRNPSSWIRIHMPSGTSCKTVSKQRRMSSKSPPATAGGACDGPAPGSSKRCLYTGLLGSTGALAASSCHRLPPCRGLSSSL